MLEEEYQLRFFEERGYVRNSCEVCGTPFWSLDSEQTRCNDAPCVEYGFIGAPVTSKSYDLDGMRERFLTFFEEKGHTRIARYPVIARWRDDVFLVHASIYDFQPLVTCGKTKPPANPLVVSQPCIRLTDIDLVGKTGKHLTMFEMLGHHAFNSKDKEIYWKEETVEHCNSFFTKALGVRDEAITFKEKPWFGGGNAGPAMEVLISGIELATLVFMNMTADKNGKIKLGNERYSPMELRVVDPGYGLERIAWASQGTSTIFEAVYPDMLNELIDIAEVPYDERVKAMLSEYSRLSGIPSVELQAEFMRVRKEAVKRLNAKGYALTVDELIKTLEPIEKLYAVLDHSKSIAFMLGDGIVPSNVKAGYLVRLLIRRCIRLMDEVQLDLQLSELVIKQIDALTSFPELAKNRDTIKDILELESGKYAETIEKGTRIVRKKLKERKLNAQDLISLYDTYGIHPTLVEKIDQSVKVPENFYTLLAEMHSAPEEIEKVVAKIEQPATQLLYYEDSESRDFDAVVLYSEDDMVVLDRTAFFPEGGGQSSDLGVLITKKKRFNVTNVQKVDDVVLHTIDGKIEKGEIVHGRVDWGRRTALCRHHTSTHIALGAARMVLGGHIWQAGAKKDTEKSRLDISHYKKLTIEELNKIELLANNVVMENRPIERLWVDRMDAEKKYGFRLYQGGVPEGDKIRVVRITDFDTQACGGIHCKNTSEVGPIKILRSERIQDGVERLEFAAGVPAIKQIQAMGSLLQTSASALKVLPEQLPSAVARFFEEWKELNKEIARLKEECAAMRVTNLLGDSNVVGDVKIVTDISKSTMDDLVILAGELIKTPRIIAILGSDKDGGRLVIARSDDVDVDCSAIVKDVSKFIGGSGGGRPDFAQGGGNLSGNLAQAIEVARKKAERSVK